VKLTMEASIKTALENSVHLDVILTQSGKWNFHL
jgi:hypothetical protein